MSAVLIPKDQWVATFIATFRAQSHHILSERSLRLIAVQQWETRQALNPAEVALRWNGGAGTR